MIYIHSLINYARVAKHTLRYTQPRAAQRRVYRGLKQPMARVKKVWPSCDELVFHFMKTFLARRGEKESFVKNLEWNVFFAVQWSQCFP